MTLVAVLVVLAVIGVVAAVVTGAVRGDLDEPTSTLAPSGLPEGELSAEDVRAVRFSLGFRGYRMDEVDEVLERLTVELARRDAELDALRPAGADDPAAADGAAADGAGADGAGPDGAGPDGAPGASDASQPAPAGRHVAEVAEDVAPGRPHGARHLPGRHEAGTAHGPAGPTPAPDGRDGRDGPDRPDGATAARVGPSSGTAGWSSGPEGG